MAVTWQQLYRQAICVHRPLPALKTLALDAVEGAGIESLRLRIRPDEPMPLYLICYELDRLGVTAPDDAPPSQTTPLA